MKIDLVFLIILGFMVLKTICSNKTNNKEHMAVGDTTPTPTTPKPTITSDMRAAISAIYKADITAIQNLSEIASKLQSGGLTVTGKLIITDNLIVKDKNILDELAAMKESITAGNTTSGKSIVVANIIGDVEYDEWLRIGTDWSSDNKTDPQNFGTGKTAIYGGVCIIAETLDKNNNKCGGLNVGGWTPNVGNGNIKATGNIEAGGNLLCAGLIIGGKNVLDVINEKLNTLEGKLSALNTLTADVNALKAKCAKISVDGNGTRINGTLYIDGGHCFIDQWYLYAFNGFGGFTVRSNLFDGFPAWQTTSAHMRGVQLGDCVNC